MKFLVRLKHWSRCWEPESINPCVAREETGFQIAQLQDARLTPGMDLAALAAWEKPEEARVCKGNAAQILAFSAHRSGIKKPREFGGNRKAASILSWRRGRKR